MGPSSSGPVEPAGAGAAERLERVMAYLAHAAGSSCDSCAAALCGHAALMSLAAGRQDAPLCVECLAQENRRPAAHVRDELAGYILRKECLAKAWLTSTVREGFSVSAPPRCLWPETAEPLAAAAAPAVSSQSEPRPAAHWDAGDMGCGELVLELRMRLRELAAGEVLRVTARDPGAPEDMPAWCRLTGNELAAARPPDYWIRRRE